MFFTQLLGRALVALLSAAALLSSAGAAYAAPTFQTPGYALLATLAPDTVGQAVGDETGTHEGTAQPTTRGYLYFHETTGTVAFTDGWHHVGLRGRSTIEWDGDSDEPPHIAPTDPRSYLYANWPDTASRMDCVIQHESGWNAGATNSRSGAAGLAQFLGSTWARTPQGRAGLSVYDPYASIDAFGWMVHGGGRWTEWQVVTNGSC